MTTSSIRSALDREENRIKDDLLRMGSMVESAIDRSIAALKQRDGSLAQQVIDDDKQINQLRYRVEEECLTVIATQQPAAHDLRIIVAATHVAVELERMADHAAGHRQYHAAHAGSAAAQAADRYADHGEHRQRDDARRRWTRSCDSDVELARQIIARDDEVDQMYQQIFRELLTYMLEDPKNISRATFLLWVAHNLERIGDRATNLCERTIFVATGLAGRFERRADRPAAILLNRAFVTSKTG